MSRSQLSDAKEVQFCISGAVTIHPTAAIATNVMLRANPGSTLVIGAGVVIGQGCVLHACDGALELDAEVTLGNHVLIFGWGRLYASACVGASTTLMGRVTVVQGGIIPPNSLIGAPDGSSWSAPSASSAPPAQTSPPSSPVVKPTTPKDAPSSPSSHTNAPSSPPWPTANGATHGEKNDTPVSNDSSQGDGNNGSIDSSAQQTQPESPSTRSVVYGQASVQRLISMMFPHRTLQDHGDDRS